MEKFGEWDLNYQKRPWTVNAERTWHYHKRAKLVKEWRDAFCEITQNCNVPPLSAISLRVQPYLRDNRVQDLGACFPAYKAALDGIVDAGVVPDDTPEYVKFVIFYAPIVGEGDGLTVTVCTYE